MIDLVILISAMIGLPTYNFYLARRRSRNPYLWAFLGFILPFISIWFLRSMGAGKYGWPTVNRYLKDHPECSTGQGISCYQCGSKQIRSWGRSGVGDSSRLQSCNSCGAGLYVIN